MDELMKFFESLNKLYTEQQELASIQLSRPVQTATERTAFITEGHLVKIDENNKLVDCTGAPTHKVISCLGTPYNRFELVCTNLETNEPLIVKL